MFWPSVNALVGYNIGLAEQFIIQHVLQEMEASSRGSTVSQGNLYGRMFKFCQLISFSSV